MAYFLRYAALGFLVFSSMALSAPTDSTPPPHNITTTIDSPTSDLVKRESIYDMARRHDRYDKWAQFCDDDNCSQNCGTSVSMVNTGCLEQPPGRRSISIHGARRDLELIKMIVSPTKGCHCQAACSVVERDAPRANPPQPSLRYGQWPIGSPTEYCWTFSALDWHGLHTEWSFRFQMEETENPQCWPDQCSWDNKRILGAPQGLASQ